MAGPLTGLYNLCRGVSDLGYGVCCIQSVSIFFFFGHLMDGPAVYTGLRQLFSGTERRYGANTTAVTATCVLSVFFVVHTLHGDSLALSANLPACVPVVHVRFLHDFRTIFMPCLSASWHCPVDGWVGRACCCSCCSFFTHNTPHRHDKSRAFSAKFYSTHLCMTIVVPFLSVCSLALLSDGWMDGRTNGHTSTGHTRGEACCRWPTRDRTRTARSFSSHSAPHRTSTAGTPSSARSWRAWK